MSSTDTTAGPRPVVLGFGGTTRPGSASEQALRYCLNRLAHAGACTDLVTAEQLQLPMYEPSGHHRDPDAERLVAAAQRADALLIASPSYHAGVSGLVKNVLDHLEDLRDANPPYLTDRVVGAIVTARGSQTGAATLTSMRSIVHALRGWPTPLGVVINTRTPPFDHNGVPFDTRTRDQLDSLCEQLTAAATLRAQRGVLDRTSSPSTQPGQPPELFPQSHSANGVHDTPPRGAPWLPQS